MSSTGKGRFYRMQHYTGLRGKIGLPDVGTNARAVSNDTFWGGGPPTPVELPYAWLSPPARFRPDQTRNVATVTRSGGGSPVRVVARTSVAAVGERPFTATLDTAVIDDPYNLGAWIVGNYAAARQRNPALALNLRSRTPAECWRLLELEIGTRIRISNAPGSDQQLVTNAWFETSTSGWLPVGCTLATSTTWSRSGSNSLQLTPDGVTANVFAEDANRTVIAGASYTADGWLFSPGGWASAGIAINWYSAPTTYLSTSSANTAIVAKVSERRRNVFTAPAGAVYGRVHPVMNGTPSAADLLYADEITLTGPDGTVPPWPAGVTDLVIEGVTHTISGDERWLLLNTAPIVGTVAGRSGPWFRADESITDTGTDRLAF